MDKSLSETSTLLSWSLSKKIAFRFFVLYFFLIMFPYPLDFIPLSNSVFQYYYDFMNAATIWFGKSVMGIKQPIEILFNGSGDTTLNYVREFFIIVLALIGTIIWSLLARKYPTHQKFSFWFSGILKYYLFYFMWSYGFAKVFQSQFPFPSLIKLSEPLGNFSPMGLAWSYMGYSPGYNLFTGGLEVLAGCLLVFKRTTALGAIMLMGVMLNVFMMNLLYDIPVKIFSAELILMGAFILAPDFKRVVNVFFLNKTAEPADLSPFIKKKKLRIILGVLNVLIVGYLFTDNFISNYGYAADANDIGKRPPLYGIYKVEKFIRNGDTIPPLTTDSTRWFRLIVQSPEKVRLENMKLQKYFESMEVDSVKRTGIMKNTFDSTLVFNFTYQFPQKEKLIVEGIFGKDTLKVEMQKVNVDSFLLIKRGFHWINEEPFNKPRFEGP
ncbi:MAG: hypothetical protein IAF38_13735 [Bacteroidia bacterium]|nr:hypothetical protein [Bacteroidia bacterium]